MISMEGKCKALNKDGRAYLKQTSRKSTSGLRRAHTEEAPRTPQNRRTSDSSLLMPSPSIGSTQQNASQPLGLKLVFKRQSGDKYEISSPLSGLSSSEFQRKVKFSFSTDEEQVAKRVKLEAENESIPFEPSDLVEKDETLVKHILSHQPRVKITHSIPFPIALVEDKTNIVYTKALLLIHLYKSYSSPCIICVLCKNFFTINEFSKHFHLSDDELDEDDDEEEDEEEASSRERQKGSRVAQLDLQQKRERKLATLRKKSYKILPYCLNKNNELNEDQLKIWKIFGERFTKFKQMHQQALSLKAKTSESSALKSSLKKKHESSREKDKENKVDNVNWDYVDVSRKSYLIRRERLENEQIIYLSKGGERKLGSQSSQEMSKTELIEQNAIESPDLHLSEDEEEDEHDERSRKAVSPKEEQSNQRRAESPKTYFYMSMPTSTEKRFNYYENLSTEILRYIQHSPHLVMPQSLILYNIRNRLQHFKNLLMSPNQCFKLEWLCLVLDLDSTLKQRDLFVSCH